VIESRREKPVRVLIAKPGLDGHDLGAKLVCRALMDAGMEVVYTGLHQSPEAIARVAVDEGVDVVGLSFLSGSHVPLSRAVGEALRKHGARVLWLVGGTIPNRDREALVGLGVDGVFPTGSPFEAIVEFIRERVGASQ
jgi:methylmalonyl-CoA mutase C-terminal domain/subunit